jgi:hypothetical protein
MKELQEQWRSNGDDIRLKCWTEFIDAAESAERGDYKPALNLCAAHPVVRTELRAFTKAIREGRVRKIGPYQYEPVRGKRADSSKG